MEILARFLLAAVNSLYFVHHHAAGAASLTRSLLARPRPRRPFPWPKLRRLVWWAPMACVVVMVDTVLGMVRDGADEMRPWLLLAVGSAGFAVSAFALETWQRRGQLIYQATGRAIDPRSSVRPDPEDRMRPGIEAELDRLRAIVADQQEIIAGYRILMEEVRAAIPPTPDVPRPARPGAAARLAVVR